MTTVTNARARAGRARLSAAHERSLVLPAVTAVCALALTGGFLARADHWLSPKEGLGYWLGVAGLAAMTALLLYSVRKRLRALQALGPLRHWFHVHMLLGVLGPVAILFHANFEVRSMNAAIALVAMLIVAGSGFIGRFAYARVHQGLFGRRESLREVIARAAESRTALHRALAAAPGVESFVRQFEAQALAETSGFFAQLRKALLLGRRTRAAQRRARAILRKAPPGALPVGPEAIARVLAAHLALVRHVAEFAFYERVLALWHSLHVPLCVVLFIAATVHVIAVHLY